MPQEFESDVDLTPRSRQTATTGPVRAEVTTVNTLILAVGITVLIGLSLLIGMSMDTEAQRSEWREVAHERKEHREELTALHEERERLRQERLRLAEEVDVLRNRSPDLCERCPLRRYPPTRRR
jgi:predicted nuclease with TOPRIM domain